MTAILEPSVAAPGKSAEHSSAVPGRAKRSHCECIRNGDPSVPASRSVQPATDNRPLTTDDTLEDLAQEAAKNSSNTFLKAAMNIAAMDFFTVLYRFDTVTLSKRLNEKPELYFQLMNSFCNLMRVTHEQQKLEFSQKQAEARQRERDRKLRARKPILITHSICANLSHLFRTPGGEEALTVRRGVTAEPTQRPAPATQDTLVPASPIKGPTPNSFTSSTGESNIIERSVLANPFSPPFTEASPAPPPLKPEPDIRRNVLPTTRGNDARHRIRMLSTDVRPFLLFSGADAQ